MLAKAVPNSLLLIGAQNKAIDGHEDHDFAPDRSPTALEALAATNESQGAAANLGALARAFRAIRACADVSCRCSKRDEFPDAGKWTIRQIAFAWGNH
jgi:hypothetical protein